MLAASGSDDKDSVTQNRDEMTLDQMWDDLREEWLKAQKTSKTRTAYTFATSLWLKYLAECCSRDGNPVHPWTASTEHALQWQDHMVTTQQTGPTAVNLRLDACDSWYNYIVTRSMDVSDPFHGVFRDSEGNIRTSPFRRDVIKRLKNIKTDNGDPLSLADVIKLLNYLMSKRHTKIGSRNYALALTFVITGWHSDKVLSLTWRDICPGHIDDVSPLSRRCHDAILDYLRRVGRDPEHMLPDEYIWQPVAEESYHNLKNTQDRNLPSNRPVNRHGIAASIRKDLRDAGVLNWKRCSIGNLSSAHRFLVDTTHPNPTRLQDLLPHTSLATTCIVRLEN
jgi:hypothetical protein